MASDASISPGFSDWNSVFVRYCDGSSFTGDNATALKVNGTRIHYRGAAILSSVFSDLSRFGINNATDVVVAGCSAGGLAVLLNIDRVKRLLPASARIRAMSDAGFFIDANALHGAESLCVILSFH